MENKYIIIIVIIKTKIPNRINNIKSFVKKYLNSTGVQLIGHETLDIHLLTTHKKLFSLLLCREYWLYSLLTQWVSCHMRLKLNFQKIRISAFFLLHYLFVMFTRLIKSWFEFNKIPVNKMFIIFLQNLLLV